MAALRMAFIVTLILLALGLVVMMFIPTEVEVSRSVEIEAPVEKIYPYLSDLRQWQHWTPWSKQRYPELVQEFAGSPQGEGAELRWKGPELGDGWLKITDADPAAGIRYELRSLSGKVRFQGEIRTTRGAEGAVVVTWNDVGDLGFFGPLFKGTIATEIGKDFDRALKQLKRLCES